MYCQLLLDSWVLNVGCQSPRRSVLQPSPDDHLPWMYRFLIDNRMNSSSHFTGFIADLTRHHHRLTLSIDWARRFNGFELGCFDCELRNMDRKAEIIICTSVRTIGSGEINGFLEITYFRGRPKTNHVERTVDIITDMNWRRNALSFLHRSFAHAGGSQAVEASCWSKRIEIRLRILVCRSRRWDWREALLQYLNHHLSRNYTLFFFLSIMARSCCWPYRAPDAHELASELALEERGPARQLLNLFTTHPSMPSIFIGQPIKSAEKKCLMDEGWHCPFLLSISCLFQSCNFLLSHART